MSTHFLIAQVAKTAEKKAKAAADAQASDAKAADAKGTETKGADAKGTDGKADPAKAGEAAAEGAEKAAEVKPEAVESTTASIGPAWYSEMFKSGAIGYMNEGGFFMWPILILAIISAGVMIERFRSLKMVGGDTTALREKTLALLQADRGEEALEFVSSQKGPVPAVLTAGLRKYVVLRKLNYDASRIEDQVIKAMEDYGVHIVAALERHLAILATIASVAPMLGSVGTVVGMIILFKDIVSQYSTTDIILAAAAGIQVKLMVTVWGLIVGIPAYVAFNYFTTVINRYVLDVEQTASELMGAVTLHNARQQLENSANSERVGV